MKTSSLLTAVVLVWLSLTWAPPVLAEGQGGCESVPGARFSLQGPVERYVRNVTKNWLLEAPTANPALLAMFRDRDRTPYRNLLPWSGEFAGKYLVGATQVLQLSGDPALRDHLTRFVAELVPLQDKDGYLGPFPRTGRLTGQAPNVDGKPGPTWDAWGHYHMMLGLLLWEQQTGDPAALAAASRIGDMLCERFLGPRQPRLVDTGSTEMNLAPAHSLLRLYQRTGTTKYRDLATQIVDEFAATDAQGKPLAGDYLRRGLAGEPFYTTPKPRWESLHPILTLAELARITGEGRYRAAFENLWWSIAELDRHNNGGFSSGEQAQGNPYHPGAIETCCTIAWMAMSLEMLKLTGNPIVADEFELSTLNSGLGLFSPTGRWSTYNTPMDGVRNASFHEIGFQCRPGSPELNCCSVNAARGLGLISEWAVLRNDDNLFLNWYGPGTITAPLKSGVSVKLTQETEYPRRDLVKILVDPDRSSNFALRLRIPHWSAQTTVKVNGEPVPDVRPGRYLELRRDWHAGDRIELTLDLSPRFWVGERECAGLTSIYRGPVLLAYDRRFNTMDPTEVPALSLKELAAAHISDGPQWSLVHLPVATSDGRTVQLCDFASAGGDGSPYRTWLKVEGATASPFHRAGPRRTGPVPSDSRR